MEAEGVEQTGRRGSRSLGWAELSGWLLWLLALAAGFTSLRRHFEPPRLAPKPPPAHAQHDNNTHLTRINFNR